VTWILSIHPELWDDADEAFEYYADIEEELPQRFMSELRSSFKFVRVWPLAGRIFHVEYRRVALRSFPYLVCYRVIDDTVRMLAIIHDRRDPAWVRKKLDDRS